MVPEAAEPHRLPRAWRGFLAAAAILVTAYVALSRSPVAQAWMFLGMSAIELGALLVALRWQGLRHQLVWRLIALAVLLNVPATVLWYWRPVVSGIAPPVPSVADVLYVASYCVLLGGLYALIRSAGPARRGDPLDAGIIAIGAGLVFWVLAVDPAMNRTGFTLAGRLTVLSYPMLDLGLVAIAARMVVSGHRRTPAFWLIGASVSVQLLADLGYSTTTLQGTFRYGGWVTTLYLVQYALMGAAALHPTAADVTSGGETASERGRGRILLLAAAAAIGPCLLLLPGVRADHDRFVVVVAGSVALVALTFLRLSRLMVDVATFRASQKQLREAELRYRTLVEHMPGVVYIAEYGENGDWVYVSPKIQELLGYTMEEWLAHPAPWSTHVHPDDLAGALADERTAKQTGRPLSSVYRLRSRHGRLRWIRDEAALVPDADGTPRFWQGVMTDVTPMKETEQQLRAAAEERRRLLGRLVSAQEEERRRVAEDIHDDPIQKMTAVAMRLAAFKARLDPDRRPEVERLEGSVVLAITRLRRLMFELRPAALDREGLEAALRQYLHEAADEAGFEFSLANEMVAEPGIQTRAAAYRIAQEAVANVRKHAAAARVSITLATRDEGVHVRLSDDGAGFAMAGDGSPPGHMGITAMRERAELAGGWLRIDSAPGSGTVVEFWIPDAISAAPRPEPVRSGAGSLPG